MGYIGNESLRGQSGTHCILLMHNFYNSYSQYTVLSMASTKTIYEPAINILWNDEATFVWSGVHGHHS
jgi:hypothetical protein